MLLIMQQQCCRIFFVRCFAAEAFLVLREIAFRGDPAGASVATEKVMNFNNLVNTAVDFRKRLRFPRGDLEPPQATPCGVSRLSLSPRRSLRLLLQSTARNHKKDKLLGLSVALA